MTEKVVSILQTFRNAKTKYDESMYDMKYQEDRLNDILHDLELADHTYHERAALSAEIVKARRIRRKAKNEREKLEPLIKWIEENSSAIKGLERVLGDMRKQDTRHANQIYIRRTDPVGEIIRNG